MLRQDNVIMMIAEILALSGHQAIDNHHVDSIGVNVTWIILLDARITLHPSDK